MSTNSRLRKLLSTSPEDYLALHVLTRQNTPKKYHIKAYTSRNYIPSNSTSNFHEVIDPMFNNPTHPQLPLKVYQTSDSDILCPEVNYVKAIYNSPSCPHASYVKATCNSPSCLHASTGVFYEYHEDNLDFSNYLSEPSNPPVNEVRARIANTSNDAITIMEKICINAGTRFVPIKAEFHNFMKDIYECKAKCNTDDGDAFDLETGKKIARERVLERYHRDLDKSMQDFLKQIRVLEAHALKYMDKHNIEIVGVPTTEEIYDKSFT